MGYRPVRYGDSIFICDLIYFRRKTLFRWALWVALSTCLLVHGLVIWIVFKYVLAAFDHFFSPLLWLPFMPVQIFALLVCLSEDRTGIDRHWLLTCSLCTFSVWVPKACGISFSCPCLCTDRPPRRSANSNACLDLTDFQFSTFNFEFSTISIPTPYCPAPAALACSNGKIAVTTVPLLFE